MLPSGFIDFVRSVPELKVLEDSLLTPPDVSVRLNPDKATPDSLPIAERVPWCNDGWYLTERPRFTFDPALHQGRYYVQDASSMVISTVVKELTASCAPVRYLDACAAPGGKTTAAISALPAGSLVLANEFDRKRAEVLVENVAKWGSPAVMVSRGDSARLSSLHSAFDIVAIDAPCSGEGMMRKEEVARSQWSPALVDSCAALQREIIDNVWPTLRPGGHLIYSTCTFNLSEDEDNLNYLVGELGATPVEISALNNFPEIRRGIRTALPCYRFIPGHVRGEGLFIAVVRKPGNSPADDLSPAKRSQFQSVSAPSILSDALDGEFTTVSLGENIYALPSSHAKWMLAAASRLDVLSAGVHVATAKGRDFIPAQPLALSTALRRGTFPEVDVDFTTAIAYLRHEAVAVTDAPRGFVLLTYQDAPLGFVKNIGNRANNLYPKSWRILSSI